MSKKTKAAQPVAWQNRITGSGTEQAGQLLANPLNWRVHPKEQQEALGGVLSQVGWVQDVIVNQRTGHLVDGHLRVTLALRQGDDTPVPVKYVDLSESEEALILATLDPLSAMAATDKAKLDELLRDVNTDSAAVQELIAETAAKTAQPGGDDWQNALAGLPGEDRAPFQQMTFTVHDSQVEVIKAALQKAKAENDFSDSDNQNSNGNALAHICGEYANG